MLLFTQSNISVTVTQYISLLIQIQIQASATSTLTTDQVFLVLIGLVRQGPSAIDMTVKRPGVQPATVTTP